MHRGLLGHERRGPLGRPRRITASLGGALLGWHCFSADALPAMRSRFRQPSTRREGTAVGRESVTKGRGSVALGDARTHMVSFKQCVASTGHMGDMFNDLGPQWSSKLTTPILIEVLGRMLARSSV